MSTSRKKWYSAIVPAILHGRARKQWTLDLTSRDPSHVCDTGFREAYRRDDEQRRDTVARGRKGKRQPSPHHPGPEHELQDEQHADREDRKSTRLNSSHVQISS